MNFLKKTISKQKLAWFIFTIACLVAAPSIFEIADTNRGYDGTGGEIMIFMLPVLAWLAYTTIIDIKEEMNEYGK